MAVVNSMAGAITKRMPKVISPTGHAIADYLTMGAFLVAGALFWRRNKRAALASLVCGGAELALNLLTNYPGGIAEVVSFPTHCKIDTGMAAMIAEMPRFMKFEDDKQKTFFLVQAAGVIAVANLSDYDRPEYRWQERIEHARERAA